MNAIGDILRSVRLSDRRAEKILGYLVPQLKPGEAVQYLGVCSNLRPLLSHIVLTSHRVLGFWDGSPGSLVYTRSYSEIDSFVLDDKREHLTFTDKGRSIFVFKTVPKRDHPQIYAFLANRMGHTPQVHQPGTHVSSQQAPPLKPFGGAILLGKPNKKEVRAIEQHSYDGIDPWLVLAPSGSAGVLAAWEDRLSIIKTGGMTGMMAGAMGGGRAVMINFRDITGIEYNSGFLTGVLEILTPSYQGTANHDYWSGALSGRNANAGDPYTLSNTLPLGKFEYEQWLEQINGLRSRVNAARNSPQVIVHQSVPPESNDVVSQLRDLAALKETGALTEAEFNALKQRIIET